MSIPTALMWVGIALSVITSLAVPPSSLGFFLMGVGMGFLLSAAASAVAPAPGGTE
jgi:hypothetical protein